MGLAGNYLHLLDICLYRPPSKNPAFLNIFIYLLIFLTLIIDKLLWNSGTKTQHTAVLFRLDSWIVTLAAFWARHMVDPTICLTRCQITGSEAQGGV